MPYYAQIDSARVCIAVTQTAGPVTAADMAEVQGLDSSLLGSTHNKQAGKWVPPTQSPAPRHITVGAFYDRFGAEKYAILASTDPMINAVIKDASVRSYIDLDSPDLPAGLAVIQAGDYAIDAAAILDTPVQETERP